MATTFADVKRFLDERELKYDDHEELGVIAIGFGCNPEKSTYRDAEGESHVQMFVRLAEDGEFVSVFVPRAWKLDKCEHRAAVCEAATRVQAHLKLVRFDLANDGNLHVNIEIPLEDSPLSSNQLYRAITGVLLVIAEYDTVIRHAIDTGEVNLDIVQEQDEIEDDNDEWLDGEADDEDGHDPQRDSGRLNGGEPSPDIIRILDIATGAGGLDAVERLLGGGDAPPIET